MKLPKRFHLVLASIAIFGVVAVSAASLGSFTSNKLGAADTVVAACNAGAGGATVAYTVAYSSTSGKYNVASATVSGLTGSCNGQTLSLTMRGAANVSLGSGTTTVALGAGSIVFGTQPQADAVTGVAVVVTP